MGTNESKQARPPKKKATRAKKKKKKKKKQKGTRAEPTFKEFYQAAQDRVRRLRSS